MNYHSMILDILTILEISLIVSVVAFVVIMALAICRFAKWLEKTWNKVEKEKDQGRWHDT